VACFSQLFVLPVWIFATYQVFFTEKGRADLGVAGWMVMTFVMAAVSVMLFLMGCRKLPACVIEEGE
jgi:hypothetical protein